MLTKLREVTPALAVAANVAEEFTTLVRRRKPDCLAELWRRAGLVDIHETTLAIRMEFSNFADY